MDPQGTGALIGMFGVVLGAILAGAFALIREWRQDRNARTQKIMEFENARQEFLDGKRLDAYVKCLSEANRVYILARSGSRPEQISEAYIGFSQIMSQAFLLTRKRPSREAVAALVRAVRDVAEASQPLQRDDPRLVAHRRAVVALEDAMRGEIGLSDWESGQPIEAH